jgi:AcrR family transcriptional regulator
MPPDRTLEESRPRLNRARVLTAALGLADEQGIESLTMRRLGQALGVEAMSLYNHVANKEDLLDGMIDMVFAEIELPVIGAEWKSAMGDRARSLRAALLRHRWAIGLMDSRTSPGPATLRHHDAVIGCSRRAGFSIEMAAHAFSLIDSYVYGFVLQEVTLPFDDTDDLDDVVPAILSNVQADDHPYLAELTVEHVLQVGYNYADEFDFGLSLILDALESAPSP